ncbi:MAG: hypothetical protein QOJ09_2173 [Actinomycetota bacterium]|jgi:hypothetical protein|nr:hypothetical protein [Frankiales bacterium]MDQ1374835.1 hypothetical protein [Actinomycetota bacterium]
MTTSDAVIRQERLATKVKGLRVPRATFSFSDRWMLVIGGTLLPLGVVLVLLGWYGASHTVLLFEQIPYLISGGMLGLSLVMGGGFVYFAYWMTLMVRENRTGRDEMQAVLLRMEELMQAQAQPQTRRTATATAAASTDLVATKTGTMLHRPDCVAVDGRDNLRSVTATTAGLTPCKLCDPLGTV